MIYAEDGRFVLKRENFDALLDALRAQGYQVVGPTVREGTIVYDHIASTAEMPVGWTDEQEGGFYRLKKQADDCLFAYTNSPQSWKRFLHPPVVTLWKAARTEDAFTVEPQTDDEAPYAFIGVRACELHAIAIQDRVFMQGDYVDPIYQKRREGLFIVAVNCGHAGATCFCASMGTGPILDKGFDLALTEIASRHLFVVETGSQRGVEILNQLPHRPASVEEVELARHIVDETFKHMGRTLNTSGLKETLYNSYDSPRWDAVAQRCLSCGNCTMVCPTCFCTTVEDITDLSGDQAERRRFWDSCFTLDFSYLHGGSVRQSPKARYRQWLTHKLASWIDQFDTSGCVGCGRCITWCPVGIDITAEATAIQEDQVKEEA